MNSVKLNNVLVFCVLLGSIQSVLAKGIDSGGGGAIVCRNPDGTIKSAELLDLWEAAVDRYTVVRTDEEAEVQTQKAIARLSGFNPELAKLVAPEVDLAFMRLVALNSKVKVSPPSDAVNDIKLVGCELEGLAKYNDSKENLYVDWEIYRALPRTDMVALWVHEAIYRVLRKTEGATDSRKTRALVGLLFSEKMEERRHATTPDNYNYRLCESRSGKYQAALYANTVPGSEDVQVFMTKVDGSWVTTPTTHEVRQPKLDLFNVVAHFGKFVGGFDEYLCRNLFRMKTREWWDIGIGCGAEVNYPFLPSRQVMPVAGPLNQWYVLSGAIQNDGKSYLRIHPTPFMDNGKDHVWAMYRGTLTKLMIGTEEFNEWMIAEWRTQSHRDKRFNWKDEMNCPAFREAKLGL